MPNRYYLAIIILTLIVTPAAANSFTGYETAKKKGVKACLSKLKSVGQFVVDDNNYGTHAVWNSKDPDKRMFSTFITKDYSDGNTHVSLIVGPDKTGKCFAEYNETAFWRKSCSVLREEVYSKYKFSGSINKKTINLSSENDAVDIYLTPQSNGSSCMTTKREVLHYNE